MVAIKIDSKGPVFYRQKRVTQFGKEFRIFKFRTMVANADKIGSHVTLGGDSRITRVGKFIRKCRLDEISQLIDVFRGKMTFVGTRPEAVKYVEKYINSADYYSKGEYKDAAYISATMLLTETIFDVLEVITSPSSSKVTVKLPLAANIN